MFFKSFRFPLLLAVLVSSASAWGQVANNFQSVLINFRSGELAVFDDPRSILKWKGPDNIQSTELFERDFGYVNELAGGRSMSFEINWNNYGVEPQLLVTTIGYPENTSAELMVKENTQAYKPFPAGAANKLTQITVPLQNLQTGLNTITLGVKKGFIGIQIVELRYKALLKGFPIGGGELVLTNSALVGQQVEKGRQILVNWSISDLVDPITKITWQYKTAKGTFRNIPEASNILVSFPNTDPEQILSSGKFRWSVPEDIASLELQAIESKGAAIPLSAFNKACVAGSVPRGQENLYNALLAAAKTSNCFDAEDNLRALSSLNLSSQSITSLAMLSDFVNLRELILDGNALTDFSPLAVLTNLENLSLKNCQLRVTNGLEVLVSLKKLDLSSNNLEKADGLSTLPSLRTLIVNDNQIENIDILLTKDLDQLSFDGNYLCSNGRAFNATWEEFITNGKQRYTCSNGTIEPKETLCKTGFTAVNFRCVKPAACPNNKKVGEEFSAEIPGGSARYRCEVDGSFTALTIECKEGYGRKGNDCEAKVFCEGNKKPGEVFVKTIPHGNLDMICEATGKNKARKISCETGFVGDLTAQVCNELPKNVACPDNKKTGEEFSKDIPGGSGRYRCEVDGSFTTLTIECKEGYGRKGNDCEVKVLCEGDKKPGEVFVKSIPHGSVDMICEATGKNKARKISCEKGFVGDLAAQVCGEQTKFNFSYRPNEKDLNDKFISPPSYQIISMTFNPLSGSLPENTSGSTQIANSDQLILSGTSLTAYSNTDASFESFTQLISFEFSRSARSVVVSSKAKMAITANKSAPYIYYSISCKTDKAGGDGYFKQVTLNTETFTPFSVNEFDMDLAVEIDVAEMRKRGCSSNKLTLNSNILGFYGVTYKGSDIQVDIKK